MAPCSLTPLKSVPLKLAKEEYNIFYNAPALVYIIGSNKLKNTEINCVINGVNSVVPISTNNDDYNEIMRQVDAGTLTIADAD